MKILSYIIPLYNSATWLQKCLYSVLNQDIPEEQVEIICVNDGSPDNSADIAREIAKEHPCIVVLDQENQGPSGARNTGMRYATAKYLCFVDPDDFVEPMVYGGLVMQMEEQRLDMLRFDYQKVNEQFEVQLMKKNNLQLDETPKLMTGIQFLSERLGVNCFIWRYIYRRDVIIKNNIWCFVGDYYDDVPWLPLVLMKVTRLNISKKIVYNYVLHQNSLVNNQSLKHIEKKIEGNYVLLKLLKKELNNIKLDSVKKWYLQMISLSVVSLLTLIGVNHYDEKAYYLNRLNEMFLFPLSVCNVTNKITFKIKLINFSPNLYLWIVNKHSKKLS